MHPRTPKGPMRQPPPDQWWQNPPAPSVPSEEILALRAELAHAKQHIRQLLRFNQEREPHYAKLVHAVNQCGRDIDALNGRLREVEQLRRDDRWMILRILTMMRVMFQPQCSAFAEIMRLLNINLTDPFSDEADFPRTPLERAPPSR